jgi:hypothetical protein
MKLKKMKRKTRKISTKTRPTPIQTIVVLSMPVPAPPFPALSCANRARFVHITGAFLSGSVPGHTGIADCQLAIGGRRADRPAVNRRRQSPTTNPN